MTQKLLALALLVCSQYLSAQQINGFGLNFIHLYSQASPLTVVPSSPPYEFSVVVTTKDPNDYANGTLVTCGGGTGCPLPLFRILLPSGGSFEHAVFASDQTDFTTKFPFGDYTVTLSNPGTESVTGHYTQNLYSSVIPQLTASTFNALNLLDPSKVFTLTFNSFIPDPGAFVSYVSLSISPTAGGAGGFSSSFNPGGTTQIIVPANSLLPNTAYSWTLQFINVGGSGDPFPVAPPLFFHVATFGQFTTGQTVMTGCPTNPLTLLKGSYAFKVAKDLSSRGKLGVIAGQFVASIGADAAGNPVGLLNAVDTANVAGTVQRQETLAGNFAINSDCSGGTLSFLGWPNTRPVHYDFFFVDGGTELELVSTDGGPAYSGIASQI